MTYLGADGRQYVVISAGGDGKSWGKADSIMAFALPKNILERIVSASVNPTGSWPWRRRSTSGSRSAGLAHCSKPPRTAFAGRARASCASTPRHQLRRDTRIALPVSAQAPRFSRADQRGVSRRRGTASHLHHPGKRAGPVAVLGRKCNHCRRRSWSSCPRRRTVEIEHSTDEPDRGDGKRMPLVLGAAVLIAGAALFIGFNRPAPVDTPAALDAAAARTDAPLTAVAEISPANNDAAVAPRPAPLSSLGEPITPRAGSTAGDIGGGSRRWDVAAAREIRGFAI